MREADEPSRGRVVRPMPETGPGTGQADVPEMRQVPVPRGRGHVRQVPGAPCVAILFSLRRAAAEGLAGRVVRPMPAAPFGEGEDMNPMDVALEALYLLGVVLCCALLSREEGSREGLGSRRACLFMLALAVEAMQAGLGSLAFREPWGAPFAPWRARSWRTCSSHGPCCAATAGLPARTTGDAYRRSFLPFVFVFHLEADLEPRTAAAGMACGAASPAAVFPEAVAGVASPRMNVGQEFSRGRHDAQERQRHEAADGEQRHQVAVPGGGQVLDDFEEVEHGLDGVCDVFHVPLYASDAPAHVHVRFPVR